MLAWFQVACPACTAALQARLPAGTRSVQCGLPDCKQAHLPGTRRRVDVLTEKDEARPPLPGRRRRRPGDVAPPQRDDGERGADVRKLYRNYTRAQMKLLMAEQPLRSATDRMREVGVRWKTAAENPRVGAGAGVGADAGAAAAAAAGSAAPAAGGRAPAGGGNPEQRGLSGRQRDAETSAHAARERGENPRVEGAGADADADADAGAGADVAADGGAGGASASARPPRRRRPIEPYST